MRNVQILLALPFFLYGCATPYDPTLDIYDITDQAQVDQDKATCGQQAADYKRPFNTNGVAVAGATGLSGNLGLGATGSTFSPLAPLLGGLGGILQASLQYLDIVDTDRPRAYQRCLWQHFDRDHSGVLVEPPL